MKNAKIRHNSGLYVVWVMRAGTEPSTLDSTIPSDKEEQSWIENVMDQLISEYGENIGSWQIDEQLFEDVPAPSPEAEIFQDPTTVSADLDALLQAAEDLESAQGPPADTGVPEYSGLSPQHPVRLATLRNFYRQSEL